MDDQANKVRRTKFRDQLALLVNYAPSTLSTEKRPTVCSFCIGRNEEKKEEIMYQVTWEDNPGKGSNVAAFHYSCLANYSDGRNFTDISSVVKFKLRGRAQLRLFVD